MKQQSFWTSVCVALLLVATVGFGIALAAGPAEVDIADGEFSSTKGWVKKIGEAVGVGKYTVKYINRKQITFKQEHCPDGYVLVGGGENGERVIVTQQDHKDPVYSADVVDLTITGEAAIDPVQYESIPPDIRPAVLPPVPAVQVPGAPPAVPMRPALSYTKDDFNGEYYLNLPIQPMSFAMKKSATLSDGNTYARTPEMDIMVMSFPAKTFQKIVLCKKKKCGEEEGEAGGSTGGDFGSSSSENCFESSSSWSDSSESDSSSSESSYSSDSSSSESSSDSSSSSDAYSSAWSSESSSACAWWDWYCNAGSSSSESSSYGWSSSEFSSDSSSSSSEDWNSSSVSSESWQSSSF